MPVITQALLNTNRSSQKKMIPPRTPRQCVRMFHDDRDSRNHLMGRGAVLVSALPLSAFLNIFFLSFFQKQRRKQTEGGCEVWCRRWAGVLGTLREEATCWGRTCLLLGGAEGEEPGMSTERQCTQSHLSVAICQPAEVIT